VLEKTLSNMDNIREQGIKLEVFEPAPSPAKSAHPEQLQEN
jgi:hypothetical protein